MNRISVIIYTHNEENNIEGCIASAKPLTGSIIVIDSESTDKTLEIVKREKVQYYTFPRRAYVEPARGFGIEKADSEWVFILDADEKITSELAEEIKPLLTYEVKSGAPTHYKVPRKNIYGNKWLRHGGWWPDYQTRLVNKKYFKSWPKEIHSTPQIDGSAGCLKNPLLHFFHGDLSKMVEKTVVFEDIESELLFKAHKNATTATFFRKFLAELYRRLIGHLGFLDGTIGIIESIYQAFSKTITYLYLYEKKNRRAV